MIKWKELKLKNRLQNCFVTGLILLVCVAGSDPEHSLQKAFDQIQKDVSESKCRLLIIGEIHNVTEFSDIKYELYKTFYSKNSVNTFLEERPVPLQPFYDEFFVSKDPSALKKVLDTLDLGVASKAVLLKEYDFLLEFSRFKNVQLCCIDLNSSDKLLYQSTSFILTKYPVNEVKSVIDIASKGKNYSERLDKLLSDTSYFRLCQPKDRYVLNIIFYSHQTNKLNALEKSILRENFFKSTIENYFSVSSPALVVGQFGSYHACLSCPTSTRSSNKGVTSFCSSLNNDTASVLFHKVKTLLLDFKDMKEKNPFGGPMIQNHRSIFKNEEIQKLYTFKEKSTYSKLESFPQLKTDPAYSYLLILKEAHSMVTMRDLDSIAFKRAD